MQTVQYQWLFAPLIAMLAAGGLFTLWWFNRNLRYLPHFAIALLCIALSILASEGLFEKTNVWSVLLNSLFRFLGIVFFMHGSLLHLGKFANLKFYIPLLIIDLLGRLVLLAWGFSADTNLIYANFMLGLATGYGAYQLATDENRDIASLLLAIAYGTISFMCIFITPVATALGREIESASYYMSAFWLMKNLLAVVAVFMMLLAFGYTIGNDLLREARRRSKFAEEHVSNTMHDIRQPLHALRLKMHSIMQGGDNHNESLKEVKQTFGYLENLVSDKLPSANNAEVIDASGTETSMTAHDILNSFYEMFVHDTEEKGLRLIYKKTNHQVDVESLVLMRIASNLVSNAIKYTHEGSVSFGLKMQNDKVWLEVQDTGLGMKPDEFKIALGRHVRLK